MDEQKPKLELKNLAALDIDTLREVIAGGITRVQIDRLMRRGDPMLGQQLAYSLDKIDIYENLPRVVEPRTACMTCGHAIILGLENSVSAGINAGAQLSLEIYCEQLHATTYGAKERDLISYCNRYEKPKSKKQKEAE